MTKEQFDEAYVGEKIAVNCPTQESANEFLKIADSFGYAWSTGGFYKNINCWHVYEENTCYLIFEGLYGDRKYFETENYEIKIFDTVIY